jgi:hypothetical protein
VDTRSPDAAVAFYPSQSPVADGPDTATFAPHGIDIRALGSGRFELLVVDHGAKETIDRFILRSEGADRPIVEQVNRISLPDGTWPNGIAAMPDGGFAVSNMYNPHDTSFIAKFATGAATGGILRWSPENGWRELSTLRLSGANGIAVSADGKTVYAAEWAGQRIWRIPLDGGEPRSVATSFLPDNLHWTDHGDLLIAGQIAEPRDVLTCTSTGNPCPMAFAVARVDPVTLNVVPLFGGDDHSFAANGFGGATGALEVADTIWVGSFTGELLARFATSAEDSHRR